MPTSPVQEASRRGLERIRNALAMTAARRPAMVCLISTVQATTKYHHPNHRHPPQLPPQPHLGIPLSKLSRMSNSQKRTSLCSYPPRYEKLHQFLLACSTMMSPKSSWESLRYTVRKVYELVPLKPPTPSL